MTNTATELSVCLLDPQDRGPTRRSDAEIRAALDLARCRYEVVSVPFLSSRDAGAPLTGELPRGYRAAVVAALEKSTGEFVATLDSFLASDPYYLLNLWALREHADLVVASRFVPGGIYRTGAMRRAAARCLNGLARRVLALPCHDLSSAFRLYRRKALLDVLQHARSPGYEFLAESLVHMHGLGHRIEEAPYVSRSRHVGRSNAPAMQVAWPMLRSLPRLWRVRNSVFSADYDERAFNSLIWPQRYWQRKRFEIITRFVESPAGILDIGCGSSKIIQAFPCAVGLDILLKKLRYLTQRRARLVRGSAFRLPFHDASFRTLICSEVIEHIPFADSLFDEFYRVLRPDGVLILGTPDYGTWIWPAIEYVYSKLVPGGYAAEHITHYTRASMHELLASRGFQVERWDMICRAELILKARKAARGD